jgi:hypothetical protein
MASIQVTGLSDGVVARLEKYARDRGHDVATEAAVLIQNALERAEQVERDLERVRKIRGQMPNAWLTDDFIRRARDEGRP